MKKKNQNSVLIVTWVTPLISIVEHPVGRTKVLFNAAVACRESKGKIKLCILYSLLSLIASLQSTRESKKQTKKIE